MSKNYKLIQAREEVGLTQKEMALKLSLNLTSYVYKENGKRKIWVKEANEIITVLNETAENNNLKVSYDYDKIFL